MESDIPVALESHLLQASCLPEHIIWENWQECKAIPIHERYLFVRWLPSRPVNRGFNQLLHKGFLDILISHPLKGQGARAADLDAQCLICHFGNWQHYSHANSQTTQETKLWTETPYRLPAQINRNRYEVIVRIPYTACGCCPDVVPIAPESCAVRC